MIEHPERDTSASQPVTVCWEVAIGDVWTDAGDIEWRVVALHTLEAELERVDVPRVKVPHTTLVRQWKGPGDDG